MNRNTVRAALAQATGWRTSSYSQAQNTCVEVTQDIPGWTGVRDSTLGDTSPILAIPTPTWQAFLAALKTGHLTGR